MKTLLCLLVWLVLLVQPGAAETRLFDLRHRSAAEVATLVQEVLGGDARVVPVRTSLLISASADDVALAAELIANLDRPVRLLRIRVAQEQQDQRSSRAVSGTVAGRSGDTTVILGDRPAPMPHGGGRVVIGGDHGRLAAAGSAGSRSETHRVEQFLVTAEGAPARISVGRRLPVTERWLVLARRHLRLLENTRYETVDTGFDVTAELLPADRVELTIHPFMAFTDPRRHQEIRFSELATRVVVPVDSWVDLAATMSSQDEVSREILGMATEAGTGSGSVRVRVEVQPN